MICLPLVIFQIVDPKLCVQPKIAIMKTWTSNEIIQHNSKDSRERKNGKCNVTICMVKHNLVAESRTKLEVFDALA